ncbi:hypothetical protein L3556_11065 [Candidatus Synechococcus calcipolaris G9]|uniref:Uncharacterized protein n=1 Tax=Candidatus Synechococcus calcipolaris G9 TaxID=1497997 RepID=A0ABT6F0S8_9SYNE|nr:hypothetical protein [Candidatus Synechococcus calcipolaris]MDG2991464.1 hypothetical protein [Candidatus Synechococcus calcipolaris G9]
MVSFLALLPRSLTTFLYAVAALLRFYGTSTAIPLLWLRFTTLQWSLLAFSLGTASLVANLGLEWNTERRRRYKEAEERERSDRERSFATEERDRANEERERATRRTRIQNRWIILQIRHQLQGSEQTRSALRDFMSFMEEYGES